jgi:hypothetical protein
MRSSLRDIKSDQGFFASIRLNYSVVAICTCSLKNDDHPVVTDILFPQRAAAAPNVVPYCMLFPRFEQALFVIIQQGYLWGDILRIEANFSLVSLGYGI